MRLTDLCCVVGLFFLGPGGSLISGFLCNYYDQTYQMCPFSPICLNGETANITSYLGPCSSGEEDYCEGLGCEQTECVQVKYNCGANSVFPRMCVPQVTENSGWCGILSPDAPWGGFLYLWWLFSMIGTATTVVMFSLLCCRCIWKMKDRGCVPLSYAGVSQVPP